MRLIERELRHIEALIYKALAQAPRSCKLLSDFSSEATNSIARYIEKIGKRRSPTLNWPKPDGTTDKCLCGAMAKNTGFKGEYHCDACGDSWAIC